MNVTIMATVVGVVLTAFLGGIGWLLTSAVKSFQRSVDVNTIAVTDLYNKYNTLSADFHELLGEHKGRRKTDACQY